MRYFLLSLFIGIVSFVFVFGQNPAGRTSPTLKAETIALNKEGFLKYVENYEENPKEWVYLGNKPCIIDFYATWCGPCRRVAPILEELAREYKGQIVIYKVDTDKEKELAEAFGIKSIPTLLFCPMKGNPQIAQGALPKEQLVQIIQDVLLKKTKAKKQVKNKNSVN